MKPIRRQRLLNRLSVQPPRHQWLRKMHTGQLEATVQILEDIGCRPVGGRRHQRGDTLSERARIGEPATLNRDAHQTFGALAATAEIGADIRMEQHPDGIPAVRRKSDEPKPSEHCQGQERQAEQPDRATCQPPATITHHGISQVPHRLTLLMLRGVTGHVNYESS
jgi:hypothetical protein